MFCDERRGELHRGARVRFIVGDRNVDRTSVDAAVVVDVGLDRRERIARLGAEHRRAAAQRQHRGDLNGIVRRDGAGGAQGDGDQRGGDRRANYPRRATGGVHVFSTAATKSRARIGFER